MRIRIAVIYLLTQYVFTPYPRIQLIIVDRIYNLDSNPTIFYYHSTKIRLVKSMSINRICI